MRPGWAGDRGGAPRGDWRKQRRDGGCREREMTWFEWFAVLLLALYVWGMTR